MGRGRSQESGRIITRSFGKVRASPPFAVLCLPTIRGAASGEETGPGFDSEEVRGLMVPVERAREPHWAKPGGQESVALRSVSVKGNLSAKGRCELKRYFCVFER